MINEIDVVKEKQKPPILTILRYSIYAGIITVPAVVGMIEIIASLYLESHGAKGAAKHTLNAANFPCLASEFAVVAVVVNEAIRSLRQRR